MLTVVAYDITDEKRLRKVAEYCEDYGMRVQYSIFECRLESERFIHFWNGLKKLIDPKTDRIVAYPICARCAKEVLIGGKMVLSAKVVAYVF